MQDRGAIHHKLRQVQYRHLKREIELAYKKRPCNCIYNEVHRTMCVEDKGEPIALCMFSAENPEEWQGIICDEELDGLATARACDLFKVRRTKVEIKAEFQKLLESDLGAVSHVYPDIAALMWVLDEKGQHLSLWQQFLLWWKPAHVTPVEPAVSEKDPPDEEPDQAK